MDFWYSMHGEKTGDLNVYINTSSSLTILWTQSGDKGQGWLNGRVKVLSSSAYRLVIEGIVGRSFTSDIAIDDIDFIDKSCSIFPSSADPALLITSTTTRTTRPIRPPTSPFDCNFENDFCNYIIEYSGNDFIWTRVQGKRGEIIAGPIDVDHTTGQSSGWYIQAPIAGQKLGSKASFQSPIMSGAKCLSFYHYLQSNTIFSLNIYVKVGSQLGSFVWRRATSQGDFWKLGRVNVNSGLGDYSIVFELLNGGIGSRNDIYAIDDIQFEDGNCLDGSGIDQVCTFTNKNLCNYTIDDTNSFQWRFFNPTRDNVISKEGIKVNKIAALPFDHSTDGVGSGYLIVDSANQAINQTAVLTSPLYPANDNVVVEKCIEFYFYLSGTEAITFNIKALTPGTQNKFDLWTRNYDHSKYWWKGEVNVRLASDFKILFEAISGKYEGLLGLDDVSMRGESCSSSVNLCDFENKDLCNWMNVKDVDEFDWLINTGPSDYYGTGPSEDHTYGTSEGTYIYIRGSSPAVEGWTARLYNEPIIDPTPGCLYFWFHHFGTVCLLM
jgi:hypothetical protein